MKANIWWVSLILHTHLLAYKNFSICKTRYGRFRKRWIYANGTFTLEYLDAIQFHGIDCIDCRETLNTWQRQITEKSGSEEKKLRSEAPQVAKTHTHLSSIVWTSPECSPENRPRNSDHQFDMFSANYLESYSNKRNKHKPSDFIWHSTVFFFFLQTYSMFIKWCRNEKDIQNEWNTVYVLRKMLPKFLPLSVKYSSLSKILKFQLLNSDNEHFLFLFQV